VLTFAAPLAIGFSCQVDPSFSGRYLPDFSKARGKGHHNLQYVFPGSLYLRQNGQFENPKTQRNGYWHVSHGRIVLMYDSLFALRFPTPADVLKTGWPSSELEGLVLPIQPDGTLRLNSFGIAGGPVFFRRQYPRATRTLLRDVLNIDDFIELWDQGYARWPELLYIANDADSSYKMRAAAALNLPPIGPDPIAQFTLQNGRSYLEIFNHLNNKGLTKEQSATMHRLLATKIAGLRYPVLMRDVVANGPSFGIKSSRLYRLMGESGFTEGIPALEIGTRSEVVEERQSACEALGKLDSKGTLPVFRKLTADGDDRVRYYAETAIAKLSNDPAEQLKAIRSFMALLVDNPYRDAMIAEALGATKSKLAMPFLVNMLENGTDEFGRRTAATQLGNLGFPEAVPALIQAKLGRQQPKIFFNSKNPQDSKPSWGKFGLDFEKAMKVNIENSPTRQAAAEALWKFDQKHANKS
jgi:HEAT repeat protein